MEVEETKTSTNQFAQSMITRVTRWSRGVVRGAFQLGGSGLIPAPSQTRRRITQSALLAPSPCPRRGAQRSPRGWKPLAQWYRAAGSPPAPRARCCNTLAPGCGERRRCAAGGARTLPGGRVGSEPLRANQAFCGETAEPRDPPASRAAESHGAG